MKKKWSFKNLLCRKDKIKMEDKQDTDLAEKTGDVSQESPTYFNKLIVFIQLIFTY